MIGLSASPEEGIYAIDFYKFGFLYLSKKYTDINNEKIMDDHISGFDDDF